MSAFKSGRSRFFETIENHGQENRYSAVPPVCGQLSLRSSHPAIFSRASKKNNPNIDQKNNSSANRKTPKRTAHSSTSRNLKAPVHFPQWFSHRESINFPHTVWSSHHYHLVLYVFTLCTFCSTCLFLSGSFSILKLNQFCTWTHHVQTAISKQEKAIGAH